jgi:CheY-like chemotaxis protein/cold shock CspA family protein
MMSTPPKPQILINEDDVELNAKLSEFFVQRGVDVTSTFLSLDALQAIERKTPHLLITDIHLPDMDGRDLIRTLEERKIFVPVIALSGEVKKLDDPACIFYEKPFRVPDLVEFVLAHLESIHDMQLIRRIAKRHRIPEANLGKVVCFYSDKGWGLVRVIGRDLPVYVNSADIAGAPRYGHLLVGQIVRFELDTTAPRGDRAIEVAVVYDPYREKKAA